ncbi:hypothetical protein AB8Q18_01475 [Neisseriaceae bacterium CLB008]
MSDHYLYFVPADPGFAPSFEARAAALAYLDQSCGPCEAQHHLEDDVAFWHGGEHFCPPSCPHCDTELSLEDWHQHMDQAYSADDELTGITRLFTLPCCNRQASLVSLNNHEVMAFGRYALQCRQTQTLVDQVQASDRYFLNTLSHLLGTPLVLVWQWS